MLIFRLSQVRRFLRIKDDGRRFLDLGKFPENRPPLSGSIYRDYDDYLSNDL